MRLLFRNNPRLRPSILTSFIVLTVPVFATIIGLNYYSNERIARDDANQLVERFRVDAVENIKSDFDPIRSLIRSAAALGDTLPDFYFGEQSIGYFQSMLAHSDKIVSAYVGLNDGSFRQARRIDPQVKIQEEAPPAGATYASRVIDPKQGLPLLDRYVFFGADGKEVGRMAQPTSYDPRPRGWYKDTVADGKLRITDPDIFSALSLVGFTVAAPFSGNGKVLGVVAIDLTLDGLSEYLAERKVSAGTLSYILDAQGRVIASSDMSKTYSNNQGRLELRHISSLDNELPAVAFGARPRQPGDQKQLYSFVHGGMEYVASLSTLPADLGKRWQIFIITPLRDFTGAYQRNNLQLLIVGLIAVVLQVLFIYLLSSIISRPLERLALKVDRIKELGTIDHGPSVVSPVREISTLSRAIDTLDNAVKSFSAFVPVGLVRQLLDSDQKLQLGGHSRFLTIFFSDLEAFSTLAEETPSQELLLRVSAYLELVTKAVDAEHGTIDKFIGDGVMAFWGAPALLDDHAWRSCVAALRIKQGMEALNADWRQQGLKPLNIRVGIHSDAVLVGNIGSKERMSYTVMGDGVNVAARLEGINKEYGTRICVSHSVFKEAGERLCVRPIDDVTVKGRRSKIPIYEVLGALGAGPELEPPAAAVRLATLTRAAYEALVKEDLVLAVARYREVLAEFPEDTVALTMLKRLVAA